MSAGDRPRSGDPTHRLKSKHKRTGHHGEVGVGWLDPKGHVRISLYPGVVLSWRDNEDLYLTLFPIDEKTNEEGG